jgi:hypothetical protein
MKIKMNKLKTLGLGLTFASLLIFSGCKKESGNTANSLAKTGASNSAYYLTGLLGGQPVTISGTPTYTSSSTVDTSNTATASGGGSLDYIKYTTGCNWVVNGGSGTGSIITTGSILLDRLQIRVYVAPTMQSPYYPLLQSKTVSFNTSSTTAGAYVAVRDANGVLWTSTGDQTGSSFNIISYGNEQASFTSFTGIINCKMYDGNGNMKQLTSAAFNALAGLD